MFDRNQVQSICSFADAMFIRSQQDAGFNPRSEEMFCSLLQKFPCRKESEKRILFGIYGSRIRMQEHQARSMERMAVQRLHGNVPDLRMEAVLHTGIADEAEYQGYLDGSAFVHVYDCDGQFTIEDYQKEAVSF